MKSTLSTKRVRNAKGLLVSSLNFSQEALIACEYPNELDSLFPIGNLNNFFLGGFANLLNPDSLFTMARII